MRLTDFQYSLVGLVQNFATLPTAYAMSGHVLVERYSRLPTAGWYKVWLK